MTEIEPTDSSSRRRRFLVRAIVALQATVGAAVAFVLGAATLSPSFLRRQDTSEAPLQPDESFAGVLIVVLAPLCGPRRADFARWGGLREAGQLLRPALEILIQRVRLWPSELARLRAADLESLPARIGFHFGSAQGGPMRGVSAAFIAFAFALTSLAVGIGAQAQGGNPKAAAVKNPVPANPASIKKGQENYNKACQHCHGSNAQGDGPLAPKNPSPANLTDDKWDHGSSDGEIYFIIANGIPDSEMKGVRSEMTATDMWHIVNYLRSIGPKPPSR